MLQDPLPEEGDRGTPSSSDLHHAMLPGAGSGGHSALVMAGLAVDVGLLAGVAALLLRLFLSAFQAFFSWGSSFLSTFLGPYPFLLAPALGGLMAGLVVSGLAEEVRGAGVAHTREAVLSHGSRVRPRVSWVKLLATSLVLGSGGSAGVVGPMVQVGGSLGSALGQLLRLSERQLRILLAAGVASGIAAIVNAPLAGLFFSVEVVLGEGGFDILWVVALSVAVASGVARTAMGAVPLLATPYQIVVHPLELPLALLLGLLAACVGVLFTHSLDRFETAFARLPLPRYLAPAVGGLVVGCIGTAFPQVSGLGYDTIAASLGSQLPLALMASLLAAKLAATCFTVGSGASGGVVGPSLYLGAVLGGSVGILFQAALPQATAAPGAYALVGMAAVFSAAFHAPITAILLGLELTGCTSFALPVAVASVASCYVAGRLSPYTIYNVGMSHKASGAA